MRGFTPGKYISRFGVSALAVLLLVWIYVVGFPLAFLEGGYPAWVAKARMLAECRVGSIAFFGDSRVEAGIVPTAMPVDVSNFGVAAGTPIEVYTAVRRALECERPPHYAVISLAANDFGPLTQYFWINSVRYGFVDRRLLGEIEETASQIGDHTTLNTAKTAEGLSGSMRDWLYAVHFPSLYFSNLVQGQIFRRYEHNREQLARVLRDRGFVPYEGSTTLPEPQSREHEDVMQGRTPLQTTYFARTLCLLADRGVQVGLLLTPIRQAHMSNDQADGDFIEFLKSTESSFPNVRLINDQSPRWPDASFADGTHLNASGALRFTAGLAHCIDGETIRARCNLEWQGEGSTSASPIHGSTRITGRAVN